MAVIRYKCTVCDREIDLIERPTGLERMGLCIITDECRGTLYKLERLQDFAVGKFPPDVRGLTNYIQRDVLFNHTQAIAETIWAVEHNLGVNPSVQALVDRPTIGSPLQVNQVEIEPELVTIVDKDNLTITFDRPESGKAQIIARSTAVEKTVETVDAGITYFPASQEQIFTIGADLSSNQFLAGSTAGSCTIRIYFLDDEELDETAFATAVFNDYNARPPVSGSAWSGENEIFVNGVTYTVLTIDIGDPVNDIGTASAASIAFQKGTDTAAFPYNQSANIVVLLSNDPHANADKIRRKVFRPEWDVGPTKTLDSFILASQEFVIDEAVIEEVFPPVFSINAAQAHVAAVPDVSGLSQAAAEAAIVAAGFVVGTVTNDGSDGTVVSTTPAGGTTQSQSISIDIVMTAAVGFILGLACNDPLGADGVVGGSPETYGAIYTSDNDITTWSGVIRRKPDANSPTGLVYASSISTWVNTSQSAGPQLYSTDDGVTWTTATRVDTFTTAAQGRGTQVTWSPTLSLFACGGNTGQIQISSDGIVWANATDAPKTTGTFGSEQVTSIHWSSDNAQFICGTNGNQIGFSSDGNTWTLSSNEPGGASSNDIETVYAVGTRWFVGTDNGDIFFSDDGNTWTLSIIEDAADFNFSQFAGIAANVDGSVICVTSGRGSSIGLRYILRSVDNGVNFSKVDVEAQLGSPVGAGLGNGALSGSPPFMRTSALIFDPAYGFIGSGHAAYGNLNDGLNKDLETNLVVTSPDGLTWTTRAEEQILPGITNQIDVLASKNQV